MSKFDILPNEVQEAFEKYAECMLRGKSVTKRGFAEDADCDFVTVHATAEDLYLFLRTALNNSELMSEVLNNE